MSILGYCEMTPGGIAPETSVAEAIIIMMEHNIGALAVVDGDNVVAGMFSERDVLTKVALSGRDPAIIPVAEMMHTPVFLATSETTPGQALGVMIDGHVRHLPVVDDRNQFVGMLALRNLLQAHVDELGAVLDELSRGQAAGAA